MKDLDEATQKICLLKGEAIGLQCMINAILRSLPRSVLLQALTEFGEETAAARVVLLNSERAGEHVIDGFETYARQVSARLNPGQGKSPPSGS